MLGRAFAAPRLYIAASPTLIRGQGGQVRDKCSAWAILIKEVS